MEHQTKKMDQDNKIIEMAVPKKSESRAYLEELRDSSYFREKPLLADYADYR